MRNLSDLLNARDHKQIESQIINFIITMKEQGKSLQAIKNYVSPLVSFYRINDVMVNSKKINKFMPPRVRIKNNRGYTREEIQKMVAIADERMKALILILFSGGMRIGSICDLRLRNAEKFQDVYKLTLYERESDEYFTFVTRESSEALDAYLDMRRRYGEKLTPDSPLIREQFDIRDQFAAISPKMVKTQTLSRSITRLAERAGIRERTPLKEGQKSGEIRKTVPRAHGFRKAYTTFTVNSKMDPIKRKMLEGHNIGIDSHYYKPSEADLLEEYQTKAMDTLTINEEHRLRKRVEILEVEKRQVDNLAREIAEIKKALKRNRHEKVPI
ncbi:MAG TPA: tyrosine-type recombinase/integrase [Nitrososphaeraceae archaeon]